MLFYSEVDTYANCPVLGFGGICIAPGFFRMLSIIEKGLFLETGSFCYFDIRRP